MNVPEELLKRFGMAVVPISMNIEDRNFREGIDATRAEMVSLITNAQKATTSQPSPGDFEEVYRSIGDNEIISVHITGKLSGTLQTAQIAAEMVGSGRIHPFDSESASMGGGWLAIAAALAVERGEEAEAIVEKLAIMRSEVSTRLSMPTLKYLQRGGRVTLAKALIASLLSVKPILSILDGLVQPSGKARNMAGAAKEMAGQLKEIYGDEPVAVAVMHAEDEDMGRQLLSALQAELDVRYHLFQDLTASLVVHGGPGTIAVAAIPFKYVEGLAQ
jgi:DegV family protein with EDD domain